MKVTFPPIECQYESGNRKFQVSEPEWKIDQPPISRWLIAFLAPEARSPKPEARSPKPEARSPKPEARSPNPLHSSPVDGVEHHFVRRPGFGAQLGPHAHHRD